MTQSEPDQKFVSIMNKISAILSNKQIFILFSMMFFLTWRIQEGMSISSFADESVHVLGAKMLAKGSILYRDFVDSHGPLIFLLTQGYGFVRGWNDPTQVRIVGVLTHLIHGMAGIRWRM